MSSFMVDSERLLTVATGVFDADGVLLDANAGVLRLLSASCARPIGARVARFFVQPTFDTLAATADDGGGYRGLMTIGDRDGKPRSLRGTARRTGSGIRVVAEYDIAEQERLNETMLDLNRASALAQDGLARFGALLRSQTRPTDVVARFGGEEFGVLMPHTGLAQAMAKAEQLRTALASERIAPLARPVTSSFGVAELLRNEDAASFLRRVDAALYRAKEGGRNCVAEARSAPPATARTASPPAQAASVPA